MAKEQITGRQHVIEAGVECWCEPQRVHVYPAKMPETVEVNVVMGAQLRAIVRSALLHVRNKLDEEMKDHKRLDAFTKEDIKHVIDKELEKWPLEAEPEDTLAQWLWDRFGKLMEPLDPTETAKDWDELIPENKAYWEHEAAAVRRAVGRGGFKRVEPAQILSDSLDAEINRRAMLAVGELQKRHAALGDVLHKYFTAGQPMVSVRQVQDIIAGRATPAEYNSALQVRPTQYLNDQEPDNG